MYNGVIFSSKQTLIRKLGRASEATDPDRLQGWPVPGRACRSLDVSPHARGLDVSPGAWAHPPEPGHVPRGTS